VSNTLLTNLAWYWDLSSAAATIVDQQSGLVLTKSGTVNTLATGGPGGGACIDVGNSAGYYINNSVAARGSYTTGFTANVWVYRTANSTTGNWLFNHRGATTGTYWQQTFSTARDGNVVSVFGESMVIRSSYIDGTRIALNTWGMATLVHTGTATSLYLDGVHIITVDTPVLGAMGTVASPLALAAAAWNPGAAGGSHRGRLAMAGLWDRVLTAPEVTLLYNSGSGRRYAELNVSASTSRGAIIRRLWAQHGRK
jgi:hypothetical protein